MKATKVEYAEYVTCEKCKRSVLKDQAVMLELNTYTGKFHRGGEVPADESQGGFWFGADCAAAELAKAGAS